MSGHNKWSKIKNKKAVEDVKKSKLFSILSRTITLESKKAAGARESPGLRSAILRARAVNLPSENIDRAVTRGLSSEGALVEELVCEVYGPGGTAILVSTLTDRKNKTLAEIKQCLSRHELSLAGEGSALWAFKKDGGKFVPLNTIQISALDHQKLLSLIENLRTLDDVEDVFTNTPLEQA